MILINQILFKQHSILEKINEIPIFKDFGLIVAPLARE